MAIAGLSLRGYSSADPIVGYRRDDRYWDATAATDVDVSDRWILRLSVSGRKAASNILEFAYTKVSFALTASYSLAIL
jgi:hypothetical protein